MSTERIQTPEMEHSVEPSVPEVAHAARSLNANAQEFKPISMKPKLQLRPSAPEFIPVVIKSAAKAQSALHSEVFRIVQSAGYVGIDMSRIPFEYREALGVPLDLSGCSSSDLSVVIQEIPTLSVVEPKQIPSSLRDALTAAGFIDPSSPTNATARHEDSLVMGCHQVYKPRESNKAGDSEVDSDLCPIGADATKVVVETRFALFANELRTFKDSIVEVVGKSAHPQLLASFPVEWEKFFLSKGLVGMPGFKSLTDRFHVVDLRAFLEAIPAIELVDSSPDVYIKTKPVMAKSTSVVVLHDELFGGPAPAAPPAPAPKAPTSVLSSLKQHISPTLVAQLLTQVDRQVLELGSHLARKGLQTSGQDLVLIRLQLQHLQTLKTSLQTVLNPAPSASSVPAAAAANSASYATLLSQAAQYAMSAIAGSKPSAAPALSGVSTAATSRKASPQMSPSSAQQPLSRDDLATLIVRVVEKCCANPANSNACGVPASSLKDEWRRMFPSVAPLGDCLDQLGFRKIKNLLLHNRCLGGKLVVFYATLPSPQLHVATKAHFSRNFDPRNPAMINVVVPQGGGSPLISPSSTCSFTSDLVDPLSLPPDQQQGQRMLVELLLKCVKANVVSAIKADPKAKILNEILTVVSERKEAPRPLDSKRPPPIDTGASRSSVGQIAPLIKRFTTVAAELLGSKLLSDGIDLSSIASAWTAEYGSEPQGLEALAKATPGVGLSNGKCWLTALATPNAVVSSVFGLNDSSVWNSSNEKLIELLNKLGGQSGARPSGASSTTTTSTSTKVSHTQLTELSGILFKTIMAGGASTAKECASALKVLAARDPSAIHEIVAKHISTLSGSAAAAGGGSSSSSAATSAGASAFIEQLMNKGKELHAAQARQDKHRVYSREQLLAIKAAMTSAGALATPPEGVESLKLLSRKK